MTAEAELLASEVGLFYVEPGSAGLRRVRRGRGFSYVSANNQLVNGKVKERIESLAIPPAWEDVWISEDPQGHIQATGHDKAGRKQYVYHPLWEQIRDEVKFDRMGPFGQRLPALRKCLDAALRKRDHTREKVVAAAVAVLDRTMIRVGNPRYAAQNGAYGLTTLRPDQAEIDRRCVQLRFSGKGGAERQLVFEDARLARLVGECQDLEGQTLFSYESPGAGLGSVTSGDINRYLELATNMPFTAKDFRTWGASAIVVEALNSGREDVETFLDAVDVAAEHLGNTRAVCRDSYVHPAIEAATEDGHLVDVWKRARPGKWIDRSESALRTLLEEKG